MIPTYKSQQIETVYTYKEWLREHNRREARRKIKQRTEHLYYMKQKIAGLSMVVVGIVVPFLFNGEATVSLIALPLGMFLLLTKERVMMF